MYVVKDLVTLGSSFMSVVFNVMERKILVTSFE